MSSALPSSWVRPFPPPATCPPVHLSTSLIKQTVVLDCFHCVFSDYEHCGGPLPFFRLKLWSRGVSRSPATLLSLSPNSSPFPAQVGRPVPCEFALVRTVPSNLWVSRFSSANAIRASSCRHSCAGHEYCSPIFVQASLGTALYYACPPLNP